MFIKVARLLCLLLLWSGVLATSPVQATPPSALERTERFDVGWRFHRGDVPGAENPTFAERGWRTVDVPHDWSIEDLPPIQAQKQTELAIIEGEWRFTLGDAPAYKEPAFDDTGWQKVTLPEGWSKTVGGDIAHKFGWYRRHIVVSRAMVGKPITLLLGKVDDADETFVNGVKVGSMGSFPPNYVTAWQASRRYTIPANLLKGDGSDLVAVRVYNGEGDGGIYATVLPSKRSGPFDSESESGSAQGYTLGGIGWYRKTFALPEQLQGKRIHLTFDGVYMNSEVWLNGQKVGAHPYGYTSFDLDLTPYVRFGSAKNVLAVKVDASGQTSRWYSGSGIFRSVWLTVTEPVHIAPWGVSITTPTVQADRATVHVRTTIENASASAQPVSLTVQLLDSRDMYVQTFPSQEAGATIQPGTTSVLDRSFTVPNPHLWSPNSPTRYSVVTSVSVGGKVVDTLTTPFGFRSISFDAQNGFLLNGHSLKLRGGCVHHDNGALGSVVLERAEERRIELLKAAGFNAIRTSHNPPSPAFLEACDRLGLLVMDEAFDCWAYGKNPDDYGRFFKANWQSDLGSMIRRDRNHPCVVLWSIGNEIPEQASAEGNARARELANFVHALDPTRPVTLACNAGSSEGRNGYFAALDVAGYNYQPGDYAKDHERAPQQVSLGTESFPYAAFDAWMPIEDHPYAVGDFVWTAMDYLGEAGIGRFYYPGEGSGFTGDYPWNVSGCGDIDLIGQRKPQSYYRGILWGVGPRVTAFVDAVAEGQPKYSVSGWGWPDERASWTWPGTEGKKRTVRVYARTPQVRLVLNGRDLGTQQTTRATRYTATYTVPYEPGTLMAIGLDAQGKELERWTLTTAAKPALLLLKPDRSTLVADGRDLAYVTVELRDASGTLNPNAGPTVHFQISGPARIVGVASGNPASPESYQRPQRKAFQGRCLVILRTTAEPGEVRLTATAEGLPPTEIILLTRRP